MSNSKPFLAVFLLCSISFQSFALRAQGYGTFADDSAISTESSDSSSESEYEQEERICAIRFMFTEGKLVWLAQVIKTEQDFLALPQEKQSEILAQFPDFQTFLQINDKAGTRMPVTLLPERLEFYARAVVIPFKQPVAQAKLPQELFDGSMPYAQCVALTHVPLHKREITQILAERGFEEYTQDDTDDDFHTPSVLGRIKRRIRSLLRHLPGR